MTDIKIKPILKFNSESDFMIWYNQDNNYITGIASENSFFGDLKGDDLVKFVSSGKIIDLDDPKTPSEKYMVENYFKGNIASYGVLPEYEAELKEFIVIIEYD